MNEFNKKTYYGIMKCTMIFFLLLLVEPSFSTNIAILGNHESKQARQTVKVAGRVVDQDGFPLPGCIY